MRQEYSYRVVRLGLEESNILNPKDKELVPSYQLGIQSFNPNESRLDVVISDPDGTVLETYTDYSGYEVRGVMQGPTKINQLEVDPTAFFEGRTFLDNTIIVEYKAFDNIFGKGSDLYIAEISADRTEVRLKSTSVSPKELQYYTNKLQLKFNNSSYFAEAFLECNGFRVPIINALTEITSNGLVATFKLYEELPEEIEVKDICQVVESLGESSRFSVTREIVVIEDPVPQLKGPNFAVEVGTSTVATDYSNYLDLLSQKSWETSKGLYTAFQQANLHTSVDYTDFSDFIHFSSAAERLENARYKIELIFSIQADIAAGSIDARKGQEEIEGIIENFDHYENYLYFEAGPYAWPKKVDPETGLLIRPYVLEDNVLIYEPWYEGMYNLAEGYDLNNKDILINTIPMAIREDLDHNEPYLIFIHMIGQHFDDLWVYARAITDRYKGDNRPDFGISKELVKEAIEHFGLDLYESNQNLNGLFELCQPDGTYDSGLETYVNKFRSARASYTRENTLDESGSIVTGSWEEESLNGDIPQPLVASNYTKEVYKRIYHNIPVLLKTKGTSRGLRVLLNCFGIPNDILTFKVQGGVNTNNRPFFGPEESIQISPEFSPKVFETCCPTESVMISGSVDKIRLVDTPRIVEYDQENLTGSFYTQSVLSRYVATTGSSESGSLTDDLHKVEVGFDLNEAINRFFRENVGDFTVDTVIGDPRNRLEDYGDPWKYLRESLLNGLDGVEEKFRSPAAIIRLVRYFDTTFFRILKDFVPARASISIGAIVKDNILHRNRWKGVDVSWKAAEAGTSMLHEKDNESGKFFKPNITPFDGPISGSTITGSHGGSYKPDYNTGDTLVVTTGGSWVTKSIASGSREFNGELTGSVLEVTDGELNDENPDKKAGQPANRFGYNVWFLDLPDIPLCSSKLSGSMIAQYWMVKTEMDSGIVSASISSSFTEEFTTNNVPVSLFSKYEEGNLILKNLTTQWTVGHNAGLETFIGWSCSAVGYFGLSSESKLDPYVDGPGYEWTAKYLYGPRQILWFKTARPYTSGSIYYYVDDLLVTWKYLDAEVQPDDEAVTKVWTDPSKVTIRLGDGTSVADLNIPASETFGTGSNYWWVGVGSASLSEFLGVIRIGNNVRPYKYGDHVIDAQWYENRKEWPDAAWSIASSSNIPTSSRDPFPTWVN